MTDQEFIKESSKRCTNHIIRTIYVAPLIKEDGDSDKMAFTPAYTETGLQIPIVIADTSMKSNGGAYIEIPKPVLVDMLADLLPLVEEKMKNKE